MLTISISITEVLSSFGIEKRFTVKSSFDEIISCHSNQKKRLDIEEFFNTINVVNDPLIQIKKNLVRLLSELVENKIIQNKVEISLKSGKKKILLDQKFNYFGYNPADKIYPIA